MSASNNRVKEYDTVHHITSRIAHKVYFLGDDERNDLLEMVRRAAGFSGIQLLVWCVMTNHFHFLVYLPIPTEVDDEEVLVRVGILKGPSGRRAVEAQLAQWRQQGNVAAVDEWFARQRRRMYDVGEFMKIVKQWFTEEYNRRQSHCGTLWEAAYYDRVVENKVSEIANCAGYIHLNPPRAGVCTGYADYAWSSFSALAKGDEMALAGLRFVYGDDSASAEELMSRHALLLDDLLEQEKRRRAAEIARKRAAGFEMPDDPLTTEAMVAQAAAHLKQVQEALISLRSEAKGEVAVLSVLETNPAASIETISEMLSLAPSTVYQYLRVLRQKGIIARRKRTEPWLIIKQV